MQDELEALRNEITKKNRDQLDMMYNLDMDNFSDDTKALFKKWSDGANDAKTYFQTYINSNEAKWQAYSEWKTSTSTSIASLEGRVTANESSITSLAQWKSEATSSIASISQKANANESSITSLAQWKSEATNSIASISQKANANESSISSLTYWKNNTADGAIQSISAIRQTANSASARIDLLVNSSGTGMTSSAASIIMEAINDDTSSIKISADKIQLSGTAEFITADDLSDNGSTTVSGNRIALITDYGSTTSTSSLTLKLAYSTRNISFGYLHGGDMGSGEANDSRFKMELLTEGFSIGSGTYYPAISLNAAGGVSIVSNTGSSSGVYISANRSYVTINAFDNTRIRANATRNEAGTSSAKDYVFCTDGIYYGTTKIVPI